MTLPRKLTLIRRLTLLTGTVMLMIMATAVAQSHAQTATSTPSDSVTFAANFLLKQPTVLSANSSPR